MNIGLLWYSDNPKLDSVTKVKNAAEFYKNKHGRYPDSCYVHPGEHAIPGNKVGDILIKEARNVLLHHFWLGMEKEK